MLLTIRTLEIAAAMTIFGKVLDLFFLWLAIKSKDKNKVRTSKIAYFIMLVFETITDIGLFVLCAVPLILILELLN